MNHIRITRGVACVIGFLVGVGSGAITAIASTKTKYKVQADLEREGLRKVYMDRLDKLGTETSIEKPKEEAIDVYPVTFDMKKFKNEVAEIARDNKYTSILESLVEKSDSEELYTTPYSISLDQFSEENSYQKIFGLYYSDGVLADENGNLLSIVVDDGEDLLGLPDNLIEHIGDFTENILYCRDDNSKVDYRIECVPIPYSDNKEIGEELDEEDI